MTNVRTFASKLTRGQKNRLTRLAKSEADRQFAEGYNALTPDYHSRYRRLSNAVEQGNYAGMLQFVPKRALKAKGIIPAAA